MSQNYRCPECRTRRATFTSLLAHAEKHNHRVCGCGGYHYPHRRGSRFCVHNTYVDYHVAKRDGATGEGLWDAWMECVWDRPGVKFNEWRD